MIDGLDSPSLLWDACEKNDIETLNNLINSGADVNIRGKYNNTMLSCCVEKNYFKMVKLLVERGAKIEPEPYTYGNWPLDIACGKSFFDIALYLIEKGAKIFLDPYNCAIINACSRYHDKIKDEEKKKAKEVVITMLKRASCANFTRNTRDGSICPLLLAVENKNDGLLWMLMLSGAKSSLFYSCYNDEYLTVLPHQRQIMKFKFWTPENHKILPKDIKLAIFSLLLVAKRQQWKLNKFIMQQIISFVPFGWYTWPPLENFQKETGEKYSDEYDDNYNDNEGEEYEDEDYGDDENYEDENND